MPPESTNPREKRASESGGAIALGSPLVRALYSRARADRWKLAMDCFREALTRSACGHFRGTSPSDDELARYLDSLHIEDLGLACACSEGCEAAWDFFMASYREDLYRAARAVVGHAAGEAQARDLADSLYAELYGLSEQGVVRRSLFDYFHGRSKLSTWLRAVMAQRRVDAIRASRRTESIDSSSDGADEYAPREFPADAGKGPNAPLDADPDRARYLVLLEAALAEALSALAPRDRLRLSYYYVHERTLAEIGRILSEHEATVSRHLDRIRRELRSAVVERLRTGSPRVDGAPAREPLSEAQIDLCFEYAMGDWPFDLGRVLTLHEKPVLPDSRPLPKPRGKE
jgi:RNA polymerase sigma factor (sigma-70 family)